MFALLCFVLAVLASPFKSAAGARDKAVGQIGNPEIQEIRELRKLRRRVSLSVALLEVKVVAFG